jgi:hypothetical protein
MPPNSKDFIKKGGKYIQEEGLGQNPKKTEQERKKKLQIREICN